MTRPKVGDRVSILVPGSWQRFGVVTNTDYHPMGVDDAVEIKFEDEPVKSRPLWWDARWVRIEEPKS